MDDRYHPDAVVFPASGGSLSRRVDPPVAFHASTAEHLGSDALLVLIAIKVAEARGEQVDEAVVAAVRGLSLREVRTALAELDDAGLLISEAEHEARLAAAYAAAHEIAPPPPITYRSMSAPPEFTGRYPFVSSHLPANGQQVVYYLFRGDELRYVGMTGAFGRRMNAHERGGRVFDRWEVRVCADRRSAAWFENEAIDQLRPPENRPNVTSRRFVPTRPAGRR